MAEIRPDPPQPPEPAAGALPCVAISGASGSLGRALLRRWHQRGARLIALTSGSATLDVQDGQGQAIPLRQVRWQAGEEEALRPLLAEVDVLVLNHGLNVHGERSPEAVLSSLEVNALSNWRLLELFATAASERGLQAGRPQPELWMNTSEAEIQPAVSPLYEISKRLIGQLFSLRSLDLARSAGGPLRLRRLVLGPFRSDLNPIGLLNADWVAGQILRQAVDWNCGLVIVTPNPLTYLLMPLATLSRWGYMRLTTRAAPPAPD
ncbi:MAG: NAD-dependent epimerase/dehydratase family protein [Cyanobium sp.]